MGKKTGDRNQKAEGNIKSIFCRSLFTVHSSLFTYFCCSPLTLHLPRATLPVPRAGEKVPEARNTEGNSIKKHIAA